jgi:hypothetical protein
VTWTERTPGTTSYLRAIAYGDGTFVAIGDTVLTSPDGVTWTDRSSSKTDADLTAIACGEGTFVAVGGGGAVLTSPDGVTWTERSSGTDDYLTAIAYGDGTFVAIGRWGGTILISTDGVTWTDRTPGPFVPPADLTAIAYGSGTFVAVESIGGACRVFTSPDGVTWTSTQISEGTCDLTAIAYGDGTFVAVGETGRILTSPDGVTWTDRPSWMYAESPAIAYGNGTFVVVGAGSWYHGTVLTSRDGVTWTQRFPGTTEGLTGIAYGNGTFVAVGWDGTIIQSDPLLPVLIIGIDVKPGSDRNSINPKSKGKIRVAIFSTEEFDAPSQVDQDSLTFGATGDEDSLAFCNRPKDIDGDGLKDLICRFYTELSGFQCGDTEGTLRGLTKGGTPIEGKDSVRIRPCK